MVAKGVVCTASMAGILSLSQLESKFLYSQAEEPLRHSKIYILAVKQLLGGSIPQVSHWFRPS